MLCAVRARVSFPSVKGSGKYDRSLMNIYFFCFRSLGLDVLKLLYQRIYIQCGTLKACGQMLCFVWQWERAEIGPEYTHTHLDNNSTPSHFGLSCYLAQIWKFTFNQVKIWQIKHLCHGVKAQFHMTHRNRKNWVSKWNFHWLGNNVISFLSSEYG